MYTCTLKTMPGLAWYDRPWHWGEGGGWALGNWLTASREWLISQGRGRTKYLEGVVDQGVGGKFHKYLCPLPHGPDRLRVTLWLWDVLSNIWYPQIFSFRQNHFDCWNILTCTNTVTACHLPTTSQTSPWNINSILLKLSESHIWYEV